MVSHQSSCGFIQVQLMDKNPKAPVETVLKQLVNDRDNIVCHLAGQILCINSDSKVPTYEHRSL